MLNKEICYQCWKRLKRLPSNSPHAIVDTDAVFVYCCGHWVDVKESKPPEKCPYVLEQTLAGNASC